MNFFFLLSLARLSHDCTDNLLTASNQITVPKAFPDRPVHSIAHLLRGVLLTDIVTMDKFCDVLARMLDRHLVVYAVRAALQYAPKALQSVPMRLLPHIFSDPVVHCLMLNPPHPPDRLWPCPWKELHLASSALALCLEALLHQCCPQAWRQLCWRPLRPSCQPGHLHFPSPARRQALGAVVWN